ncbi:hypothetical protein pb186bvf_012177 [Paramecium bursaria]
MNNPLRSRNKYLRKKSDLLRDYVTGGIIIGSIALLIKIKLDKINPPDPVDEPQTSADYDPFSYITEKIRKYKSIFVPSDD